MSNVCERMATPIALAHRQRVRPLFKRSTSMQLIKYRYNALCGNANWIGDSTSVTPQDVCVLCVCVCACLSEKCTTDIMVRDALNVAILSRAYTLIVIFEKINDAETWVFNLFHESDSLTIFVATKRDSLLVEFTIKSNTSWFNLLIAHSVVELWIK